MCTTRWIVQAEALLSITENYEALVIVWDVATDDTWDAEMKEVLEKYQYTIVLNLVERS